MRCFRQSVSGVAAAALALAATAAVSVAAATPAAADIVIHVTNGADSGPGSYRQAILTANTNGDAEPDIIEFDEDLSVVLTSGNVAYTGTQPLRLNGHGSSIDGSGSFQILSTVNAAVTVDHLTVQHGAQPIGGAMSIGGSLTILKSTFRDNSASIGGAIITGSVKVTDSTFTGNRASIAGAILASDAEITGSEFSHNSAAIGGALVLSDNSEISHSEFTSNRAELGVGGSIRTSGILEVEDSTFEDDEAAVGGSIAMASSVNVITSASATLEVDPHGAHVGDLSAAEDDDPPTSDNAVTLDGVTIAGDEATIGGGVAGAETVAVENGVVTELSGAASLEAVNSTFTDNKASQAGGAASLPEGDVSLTYVTSSHNGAPDGAQVQAASLDTFGTEYGSGVGGENCDVEDSSSDGDNFSTDDSCELDEPGDVQDGGDPGLGELADNGGPTPTRLPLDGSPLIDAIPVDQCDHDGVHEDQRDVARPQGDGCDIGAVEVELVAPAPAPLVIEPTFTG